MICTFRTERPFILLFTSIGKCTVLINSVVSRRIIQANNDIVLKKIDYGKKHFTRKTN